jgi:hypothetical protein
MPGVEKDALSGFQFGRELPDAEVPARPDPARLDAHCHTHYCDFNS